MADRNYNKKYYAENKQQIDVRNLRNQRAKRADNEQYRLGVCIRNRLYKVLIVGRIGGKAANGLGCSVADLKARLEMLFLPGMTWENYGKVWEFDHIKPLSSFDLCDRRQYDLANCFANIQPMYRDDNKIKRARINS